MRTALLSAAVVVAISASPSFAIERPVRADRPARTAIATQPAATAATPAITANANATSAPRGTRTRTRGGRATPAVAAPVVTPLAVTAAVYDPIDSATLNAFHTEIFGAVLAGDGVFNDVFAFTLDADYLANSQVSTIDLSGIGVDFTSILLDGFAFTQSSTDPETWVLDPSVSLLAGLHNIYVNGTIGTAGTGSYSGNINLTAVPGAIPEPGTWMLMLLGFGGIGYSVRKSRKKAVVPQLA